MYDNMSETSVTHMFIEMENRKFGNLKSRFLRKLRENRKDDKRWRMEEHKVYLHILYEFKI